MRCGSGQREGTKGRAGREGHKREGGTGRAQEGGGQDREGTILGGQERTGKQTQNMNRILLTEGSVSMTKLVPLVATRHTTSIRHLVILILLLEYKSGQWLRYKHNTYAMLAGSLFCHEATRKCMHARTHKDSHSHTHRETPVLLLNCGVRLLNS